MTRVYISLVGRSAIVVVIAYYVKLFWTYFILLESKRGSVACNVLYPTLPLITGNYTITFIFTISTRPHSLGVRESHRGKCHPALPRILCMWQYAEHMQYLAGAHAQAIDKKEASRISQLLSVLEKDNGKVIHLHNCILATDNECSIVLHYCFTCTCKIEGK